MAPPPRPTHAHDRAAEAEPDYLDLREYAAIGDGRTLALVSRSGRIDWLPVPSLDSVPVFAALLDASAGGSLHLHPESEYTSERRYVPGTNVLETTHTTEDGVVRVTDALTTGVAGRLPWLELVRRVECVKGSVPMTWSVAPGTGFGRVSPWVQQDGEAPVLRVGTVSLGVSGLDHGTVEVDRDRLAGERLTGRFTASKGSRHLLTLSGVDDEPLHMPRADAAERSIERTVENWRTWSETFGYDGPWADAVQRSALALKLLIHAPTGAIAAAGTTSLPEDPAGGKNWDYRFAWIRDLAYTVRALVRFGLREETHAALSWLLATIEREGPGLHIFYTLEGEVQDGVERLDAPGWRGIAPVESGNRAAGQLQLGVFGDLFSIVRTYVGDGNVLDQSTGRLLAQVADTTCDQWRNPDAGIWELTATAHYTSSKMGCWQALDAAAWLAENGHLEGRGDRWRREAERVRAWVGEHCWSESRSAYTLHPDTDDLDAAVLLYAQSGFDVGERMSATIDAVTGELGRSDLVYRYTGAEKSEKTFYACAFWRVSALACVGRVDEARAAMDALVATTNDVGLMPEMIDADDHSFWGNLPQALSHLALIVAAITIEERS